VRIDPEFRSGNTGADGVRLGSEAALDEPLTGGRPRLKL
jgi:hypothetical protein